MHDRRFLSLSLLLAAIAVSLIRRGLVGTSRSANSAMVRMLGYASGNFDILFYYAKKRDVPAW